MNKLVTVVFCFFLSISSLAFAGNTVTVDLDNLSAEALREVVKSNGQISQATANLTNTTSEAVQKVADSTATAVEQVATKVVETGPNDVKEWMRAFTDEMAYLAEKLGTTSNDLLMSPIGAIISVVLAMKYGAVGLFMALFDRLLGFICWLSFLPIWIWSFRRAHFTRISRSWKPWDTNPGIVIEPVYKDYSLDKNGKRVEDGGPRGVSMLIHGFAMLIATTVCIIIAFA